MRLKQWVIADYVGEFCNSTDQHRLHYLPTSRRSRYTDFARTAALTPGLCWGTERRAPRFPLDKEALASYINSCI